VKIVFSIKSPNNELPESAIKMEKDNLGLKFVFYTLPHTSHPTPISSYHCELQCVYSHCELSLEEVMC
jgi:hypothetical protein